jgi:hypothetical protein
VLLLLLLLLELLEDEVVGVAVDDVVSDVALVVGARLTALDKP